MDIVIPAIHISEFWIGFFAGGIVLGAMATVVTLILVTPKNLWPV